MEITIHLPELHQAQQEIVDHPARFKVIACGRRFGKTLLSVDVLANDVIDGWPVAYFAPTYKMTADVWKEFKRVLQPIISYKNESERRLEAITGGLLDCWSLDNADSVRGRKYKRIVVDEAGMVSNPEVWEAVLRPLLTDYRGGAIFPSTPKGYNLFWELYQRGLDPLLSDWQSWNHPTTDNPYIDPAEVEEARLTTPERWFRQEYLAEFIEDAGGVFRGVDEVSTAAPGEWSVNNRYVFGVDWARSYDFTVISVMDMTNRRQVALERFNQISWELQRGRLKAMAEKWRPVTIWAESNSIGDVNIEALQRDGLPVQPFQTTAQTKGTLIDGLALAIERKQVELLNDSVQKMELKSYQMERLPSGIFRYGAPDGGHDDTVIATALAWYGCSAPQSMTTMKTRGLVPQTQRPGTRNKNGRRLPR